MLKKGKGRISQPIQGNRVALKTEGKLEDGTIIDQNDRIEFILGDGDTISGESINCSYGQKYFRMKKEDELVKEKIYKILVCL